MHDSGVLDHEVLVLLHAMCQLAAIARTEGQHLTIHTKVSVLKAAYVVNIVLQSPNNVR